MDQIKPRKIFLKTSISSRLKCPICYQVFLKPRRLFCGHTFCKHCLKQVFKPHKNPQHKPNCPLCRVVIDAPNIGYDIIASKIIDQLEVMCPVNGCPWKGENQLLETHYNFECRMKDYINNISKNKNITLIHQDEEGQDAQIIERVNQNAQRGSLLSRVISKNPHLLQLHRGRGSQISNSVKQERLYSACTKTMISLGTQTTKKFTNQYKNQKNNRQGLPSQGIVSSGGFKSRIIQKRNDIDLLRKKKKFRPMRFKEESSKITPHKNQFIDIINLQTISQLRNRQNQIPDDEQ